MMKFEPNEVWKTYDSNVQAYRSNFFSTQSILVAVGAFIYGKDDFLTLLVTIIALIQMWLIWFQVITVRIRIVDFHKYGMNNIFDEKGNYLPEVQYKNSLKEIDYVKNNKIRNTVNDVMSTLWERKNHKGKNKQFYNFRETRIKIDILIPVLITLIWIYFLVNSVQALFSI